MILATLEAGVRRTREVAAPDFLYTCDILCVGAGAAGCYAADAAARDGADVILLEYGREIGGMPVAGRVTGYYYGSRGGAFEADDAVRFSDHRFLTAHGAETRQIALTERLAKSGVRVFCGVSPIGAYLEGDTVCGLLVFDGERECPIAARITVDATSDGHLVRLLDARIFYGRPEDGATVPFSVRTQYIQNGRYFSDNGDSGVVDQYDARALSRAIIRSHAAAAKHIEDEKQFLGVATRTGLREGLHYEGEETVTCRGVLCDPPPERILFYAYSDLDRHGYDRAIDDELLQNWWVVAGLATVLIRIPVPMGAVVPRGIRGFVTAGRCLSTDTYVASAVRMNRDMFRMGECIGYAAAAAIREGVDFLRVDYAAYRRRATEAGAFLGEEGRHFGYDEPRARHEAMMDALGKPHDPRYRGLAPSEKLYTPVEFEKVDVLAALRTDAPGQGIFAVYLGHGDVDADRLAAEMTAAEDPLYRYNCAIALGILGDRRAVPTLIEIVEHRDAFFFTNGRRSNQFRSAVAVCLLGRLGDATVVPLLESLLAEDEYEHPMYHTLKHDYLYYNRPDRNFVYYDMTTHTLFGLVKLYRRLRLPMADLRETVERFLGGAFLSRVTDGVPGSPSTEETLRLIAILRKRLSE